MIITVTILIVVEYIDNYEKKMNLIDFQKHYESLTYEQKKQFACLLRYFVERYEQKHGIQHQVQFTKQQLIEELHKREFSIDDLSWLVDEHAFDNWLQKK